MSDRLLQLLALLLFLPASAVADGKVMPQRAYAIPEIPDQQALIHYDAGVETLVIQTSFQGQGTNFAWVVPLPSVAKIEPVSTGVFPTLQNVFQPKIVLSVKHYWLALPLTALLIWLGNAVRRSVWAAFVAALVLPVLVLFVLPVLNVAKSRAMGSAGSTVANVSVLNRQSAGLFDVTTIKASDPNAVLAWLEQNGFGTPTNLAPVLGDYVRDGWVFAAARLDGQATNHEHLATHPLSFTFDTSKPVYPLRLTGTGQSSCRVALYVFGPHRARAPGFSVERCGAPQYITTNMPPQLEGGTVRIRHKELAALVGTAPVATKLTATLSPADMARDAYLKWSPCFATGGTCYTKSAALAYSANFSALLLASSVVIWWLVGQFGLSRRLRTRTWEGWIVPAALATGVLLYFVALPKVEPSSLRVKRGRAASVVSDYHLLAWDMAVAPEIPAAARPLTEQELERLRLSFSEDKSKPMRNRFTDEPLRFEASPGNILFRPAVEEERMPGDKAIRPVTNGYELVWHDFDGAEAVKIPIPTGR